MSKDQKLYYSVVSLKSFNVDAVYDNTFADEFNLDEHEYRLGIDGFGSELKYLFKEDGSINTISNPKAIHSKLSYSKANLIFLSADRIGPQDTYSKNINPLDQFGILGEYTISFLEKARRNKEEVINELIHENEPRKMLDSQVNYWLKYILDTEIETEEIPQTNQVKARFKNSNAYVRPKNIGSGISYLTSILIVCLSAKIGQIIIIENPEIHLHPKAQSKIGELLAFVASKGIQIIIETHNDHLINRLRYEVFKKKIEANKIIIHYKESLLPFEQIEINDNGKFKDKNGENNFYL